VTFESERGYAAGMISPLLTVPAALMAAPRLVLALVVAFGGKERREHALHGLRILSARPSCRRKRAE
jgi:hypothetical protein